MKLYPNTIEAITSFLFIETEIEPVDLMFVLGNNWTKTMEAVAKLYFNNISQSILITGNSAKGDAKKSEAITFMEEGVRLGINRGDILLEEQATNTKENIVFSVDLIKKNMDYNKINSILFFCQSFHTRRVLMTARKHFNKDINFYFYPIVDNRNIKKDNWWKGAISKKRVLEEMQRISIYTLKGDLSLQ